jgi:anthranilate 1,2-dioxygenase small subunit/terephthalate 1,2-dioxygenase oxygenase component beta subunit
VSPDAALLAVARLNADYAHCIDADELERWPGFFLADARYRVTTATNEERGLPIGYIEAEGRAMLEDRVLSLREANIYEAQRYRHIVSLPRILGVQGDEISTETSFVVVRVMQSGDAMLFAAGQYNDRIVENDGALKFRERIVVLDGEKIDTLLALPL